MSADLPHSFARVSSNNIGISHLDPSQQKTSYQQALKYNDRCPVQPANLSLGSSRFKALLISGAAMEKTNEITSCQLYVICTAMSGQLLAVSSIVVWDPSFNWEKQDTVCVPPSWSSCCIHSSLGSRGNQWLWVVQLHQAADLRSVSCLEHHSTFLHFTSLSLHVTLQQLIKINVKKCNLLSIISKMYTYWQSPKMQQASKTTDIKAGDNKFHLAT